MHVLLFLVFVLAGASQGNSWSAVFRRKFACGIVTAFTASVPFTAFAAVDEPTTNAISNVLRISYSLKNVDESIDGGSDVRTVVTQIKALMSNYKMKDNLNQALTVVPDSKKQEARGHARTAIEDMSLVTEYYTDDIDDMSGRKTPPKEVLQLAQSATVATRAELEAFFQSIPTDIYGPLKSQVGEEFTFVSSTTKPSTPKE